ncbi:MAG: hypothetical protein ACLQVI_19775 [Polyangiaceae bacterium]
MQRERRTRNKPVRPAIRRIPPEPPRYLFFPATRRRISSLPAHEVELDETELLEGWPEDSGPIPAPATVGAWQPPSLAPLAMDSTTPSDLDDAAAVSRSQSRSRRRSLTTGGAVALLAFSLAVGATLRTDWVRADPGESAELSAAAAPPETAPAAEPLVTVPVVVRSPPATVGTVVGAEGHRLWIDGRLAESFTAVVACGHHVVQVGSAGEPRDVDVPCGEEITAPR